MTYDINYSLNYWFYDVYVHSNFILNDMKMT